MKCLVPKRVLFPGLVIWTGAPIPSGAWGKFLLLGEESLSLCLAGALPLTCDCGTCWLVTGGTGLWASLVPAHGPHPTSQARSSPVPIWQVQEMGVSLPCCFFLHSQETALEVWNKLVFTQRTVILVYLLSLLSMIKSFILRLKISLIKNLTVFF